MKKLTAIALILILITVTVTACAEFYPQTAKVISVDRATDTVKVQTYNDFIFTFEGCEDWMEGDTASLIMEDNGTELVYDDVIVMAHYTAWVLER